MGLYRILFRSEAKSDFSEQEILLLVEGARIRNRYRDITGVLLYCHGCFMALMEGEEEMIKEVYFNKILKDKRHSRLKIIFQGAIKSRDFPEWNLGFKMLSHLDFKPNGKDEHDNEASFVLEILKYFYVTGEIDLDNFWKNRQKQD